MKRFALLIWVLVLAVQGQTSKELLRDGLFAEESEGDLKTAAGKYSALLEAFEKERKVAAVALYEEFAKKFADVEPQFGLVKENYLALTGKPLELKEAGDSKEDQALA